MIYKLVNVSPQFQDMTPKMRGECSSSSQDHESDDDAEWDYKEQKACCICAVSLFLKHHEMVLLKK